MKRNLFAFAGLSALVTALPASADFTGLIVDVKGTTQLPGTGFWSVNIYASFDVLTDRALSVTAATLTPLGGSQFYQNALGGATEPNPALLSFDPNLQYDTFVTIGLKQQPFPPPTPNPLTALEPGSSMTASGFTGGWFTDGDAPQGSPVPIPGWAGFHVLLMQLTVENPTPTTAVSGAFTMAWKTATSGAHFDAVDFLVPIPAPGTLILLGLAGLTRARRRR
jgi:hypothetical protein